MNYDDSRYRVKQQDSLVNRTEVAETDGEGIVTNFLQFIGEDPMRAGLRETPARVVKSWKELYGGYHIDPKKVLSKCFDANGFDELVLCKNIEFYSTCEHHLLPIVGTAHVGYIPGKGGKDGGKVVGLSKLARLVDVFARRLQIQEQMTHQIASALQDNLAPQGVGVIIEAKHFCMCSRGVGKQNSIMTTSAMVGVLRHDHAARAEFLRLCEK